MLPDAPFAGGLAPSPKHEPEGERDAPHPKSGGSLGRHSKTPNYPLRPVDRWATMGGEVSIIVRDEGKGFDPAKVPDPTAIDNIESEHGRSIYLMRALMDEIRFEQGGTELHMRKSGICTAPASP